MGEKVSEYRSLVGKPWIRKPLGRTRKKWENITRAV
jgi:hypothetical protein